AIGTNRDYGIANADEFRVLKVGRKIKIGALLEDETVDDEKLIEVSVEDFPKLLQPAYCISVHRSQCATYRKPYTIYQTKKMRELGDLGKRLLYVALSRASDISLINIS